MMKFEELKFVKRGCIKNKQALVFFKNGYGASIIIGSYSYGGNEGLYEIAVLKGNKKQWSICYDTPITDDVIGHLKPEEVEETLKQIKELRR